MGQRPEQRRTEPTEPAEPARPRYIKIKDLRPEGDEDSCLRPLGLCELGGCCDVCCYSPENRRRDG